MRLELLAAEQRRRDVDGEQPLEDRGRLLLALVAVDCAGDDLVRQARREVDRRELVGEVRLERTRQREHERVEVLALLRVELAPDRGVAERLPHAEPVAVQVVAVRAERARPAADEPAEDDAAADVPEAPAPPLHVAELLPPLRRQQADGDLFRPEALEDALRQLELVVAARRMRERVLRQLVGRACLVERLRQDRLVRGQQLPQPELEVLVVDVGLVAADVLAFGPRHLVVGSLPLACHPASPLWVGPPLRRRVAGRASTLRHHAVNG